MDNKNTENIDEEKLEKVKKKITLKEIGLEKLIILFLTGVFLVLLSFPNLIDKNNNEENILNQTKTKSVVSENKTLVENQEVTVAYTVDLEKKLNNILNKVSGIGNVEVMITIKTSKELIPLKDIPYTQESINEIDGDGGNRVSTNITKDDTTILVTDDSGSQTPYIVKEIEPKIEGVLVIAQGGGDQIVINEIVEAVQVLFDVPTHKIKVMKMNSEAK